MYPVWGSTDEAEQPVPTPQESAVVQFVPEPEDALPEPEPVPPAPIIQPPAPPAPPEPVVVAPVAPAPPVPPQPPAPTPAEAAVAYAQSVADNLPPPPPEPVVVQLTPEQMNTPLVADVVMAEAEEAVAAAEDALKQEQTPPSPQDVNEMLTDWAGKMGVDEAALSAMPTVTDDELMEEREKYFSTAEAAGFFNKSNQWLYWGMRNEIFLDPEGKPIEPLRVGKGRRRRFNLEIIEQIALACHRRGNLSEDDLRVVLRKILIAKHGLTSFDQEKANSA